MSILTGSRRREDERSAAAGGGKTDFSQLLRQFLGGSPSSDIDMIRTSFGESPLQMPIREKYIPLTQFTEYVRSPVTEQTSWREGGAYAEFRENFLNSPEPGYGIGGTTREERELQNTLRIDNLSPLTPDSIAEAEERFRAGYEHLNNYMHTMITDRDIEIDFQYAQLGTGLGEVTLRTVDAPTGKNGISEEEKAERDAHEKKFRQYLQSDEGREMRAMAEEVQFYGAIANLAGKNDKFRAAYEADPDAAVDTYRNELVAAMTGVPLPKVQTIPDNWAWMLNSGGDLQKHIDWLRSMGMAN